YKKTSDLILEKMNAKFKSSTSSSVDWLQNSNMTSRYGNDLWNGSSGNPYRPATLSVIIYDYKKNQTNSLLKHFSKELPNEYLLAPSEVGMDRFIDPEFNNLGTVAADNRAGATFSRSSAGSYIRKYRATDARPAYKDDTPIYIYRSTELYFFLAEALNNQGRFEEASALINRGVNNAFPKGGVTWEGFTDDWTSASSLGNRTYPDLGIRGCHNLGVREFKLAVTDEISLEEAIKFNDFAIMDEMFLEFPCEGKNYPAMVRAALRHGDFSHMAGRISEKYDNPEEIKAKIEAGGYFIKWDLTK
ncbi:RagB/SusD family nutrient uptake outer membrane protein, partial [Bacteroidales bacterium OttesenSCG-928-L03]|nr:RagB/SusD family nutrient uptake outer membrane protein [Bacteroidales bacterium OttesenSCG-928-L03]